MANEIKKYLNTMEDVLEAIKESEKAVQINKYDKEKVFGDFEIAENVTYIPSTGEEAKEAIEDIIKYINTSEAECINNKRIYERYETISAFLIPSFGFTPKEAYHILSFFVKRNYIISQGTSNKRVINLELLKKTNFRYTSREEVMELLLNPEQLIKYHGDDASEEEKLIYQEINKKLPFFTENYEDFCNHNDHLYEDFIKKFPYIDLEDIIEAIKDLKELKVTGNIRESLKNYFLGIFRSNLDKNFITYDIESEEANLEKLIDDKDKRDEYVDTLEKHNRDVLKKIEAYSESKKREEESSKKEIHKPQEKVYLTEEDVRKLKKYIREYYDLYNVKLIKTPDFTSLIKCIDCMKKLDEDNDSIKRFLSFAIDAIKKLDNYISNYDDLITLISYFIKYKVNRVDIDTFIIKYKGLKDRDDNIFLYLISLLEEASLYNKGHASEISTILEQMFIIDDEGYQILKDLAEETAEKANAYSLKTEYEYNLGLKKLGR